MVDDYEHAAIAARDAMVDRLRGTGPSERTLEAMARVPRHELVPVFWALPTMLGLTDDAMEYHHGDVDGLEYLHDIDRAVAINKVSGATGGTTSTASAPRLLAAQADLLALEPGMSVLEIGTGPGYFAALLSELVGGHGRVVSLDIDAEVVAGAARRLGALGYANVTAIARDGHGGAAEHAPFDRIVGSVGCNDVAAAWIAQLAPDGFALIPLSHGAVHPMVRVDANGEGAITTRSGYVKIQGRQDDVVLWPHARAFVMPTEKEPLPTEVAAALEVEPGREQIGGLGEWDLGYWVAAADQRAGLLVNLNDGSGLDRAHRRRERHAHLGRCRGTGARVRPARPRPRVGRGGRAERRRPSPSLRTDPPGHRDRVERWLGHRPRRPPPGDHAGRPVTIAGGTGSLRL